MSAISSPLITERARLASGDPEIVRDEIVCRVVATAAELSEHFAIRRAIFVDAQGLFQSDDRDQLDDEPGTVHVVAVTPEGSVVGAVRLYPLSGEGEWKGDRLAVMPGSRARHVGPTLVRCAVAIGGHRGGRRMLAYVQRPVVEFFEHLGWTPIGDVFCYRGVAHRRMTIGLR